MSLVFGTRSEALERAGVADVTKPGEFDSAGDHAFYQAALADGRRVLPA